MKKNRMMRLASILLVCVLLTTSVISGTFAKYTSTATGTDKARVAYWGFGLNSEVAFKDLFTDTYTHVDSQNGDDVIAPGTSNCKTFKFAYTDNDTEGAKAPEVAYDFTVSVEGSKIDEDIKKNPNIKWALVAGTDVNLAEENKEWGTWDELMTEILRLSGNSAIAYSAGNVESVTKRYEANNAPDKFAEGTAWTVAWQWKFNTSDAQNIADTAMGNKQSLDEVVIKITITATQVD